MPEGSVADGADPGRSFAEFGAVESPRPGRGAPRPDAADGADDEVSVSEPVDPPEPVVSAKAIGIDTAADPMPKAIANAPTRPTYRV